ncbi:MULTISPECIES: zf-HC2 domain-containing protein [unclassified Streptomyces]|uniref:zf-HC2 domain-containing protein n=1 Tax=unclassified Streptomyces TaxID=2593676 RepID=UPI002741059C|nr:MULTISPECIES: zf-HC2 domain-containing protein [unclassified Streptomyces]
MPNDVMCDKLREIGAELALGVLPGRERAGAVAHLERCADCREHIRQLTQVGDRLIGLLPGSEPPVGFETRAAQVLTQEAAVSAAAHEGRTLAGVPGRRRPGRFARRIRPGVAAVATVGVLAVGFGGWSVGTAIENTMSGPAPTTANQDTGMLWGGLMSAQAQAGKPAGEVYAHAGTPGWIFMTVDLAGAGTPYSGRVSCLLVHKDGSSVRVGSFSLHKGQGSWGAPTPAGADRAGLSGARLTAPDGTVLATTHFATGAET